MKFQRKSKKFWLIHFLLYDTCHFEEELAKRQCLISKWFSQDEFWLFKLSNDIQFRMIFLQYKQHIIKRK